MKIKRWLPLILTLMTSAAFAVHLPNYLYRTSGREPHLKIRPRPCVNAKGQKGQCMFVWDCIKGEGKHLGACMDRFLFGTCCGHDVTDNVLAVQDGGPDGAAPMPIGGSGGPLRPPAVTTLTAVLNVSELAAGNRTNVMLYDGTGSSDVLEDRTEVAGALPAPSAAPLVEAPPSAWTATTAEPPSAWTTTTAEPPSAWTTTMAEPPSVWTTTTTTSAPPSTWTTTTYAPPSTRTSTPAAPPSTWSTTTTAPPSTWVTTTSAPPSTWVTTTSAPPSTWSTTTSAPPSTWATTTSAAPPVTWVTTTTAPPTSTRVRTAPSSPTAAPAALVSVPTKVFKADCGLQAKIPEMRIVGGRNTGIGNWPWQVSVRRSTFFGFSSTHRCGGAVLNENWVATAGHCVADLLLPQIRLRIGEYDLSTVSETYPFVERSVARRYVHPKYNADTYEYDLALVRMDKPLEAAPNVGPICLPPNDELLTDDTATITGWGRLKEGGTLPSVLQEVQVPIVSNSKCEQMFLAAGRRESIPDFFICAGYSAGGKDSCQGDSGGPLQIKGEDGHWFLAGIISWGIGCGEPNLPGVCTRISKFKDWILDTIEKDGA